MTDPFGVCNPGVSCSANSLCTPSLDFMSPVCSCDDGYEANIVTNECEDINECATGEGVCTDPTGEWQ